MGEHDHRGTFGRERGVFCDVHTVWDWCVVSGCWMRGDLGLRNGEVFDGVNLDGVQSEDGRCISRQ